MVQRWTRGIGWGALCLALVTVSPAVHSEIESDLAGKMRSTILPPKLQASSWVLMDAATGAMLAGSNPNKPVEPASLTKLLTAFIVFREIQRGSVSPEDEVVVSEKAWRSKGSRMFIEAGDKVRIDDLLMGLIVQSGNDAAVALAEYVAGSEVGFADLMNQVAAELGMTNSHFTNSSGMPHPDHFSTAYDITLLSQVIIRDQPKHYARYAIRDFTWNDITQKNRNPLLGRDDSIDGIKTGYTRSAGYCLVGSAHRDGMRLIGSVMGAEGNRERADAVYSLLRFGFAAYERHDLYLAKHKIVDARVFKGAVTSVEVGLADPIDLVLPKGAGKSLQATVQLTDPVVAPLEAGQLLGTLTVQMDGADLLSRPLVTLHAVAEGTWFNRMADVVRLWFH